MEGPTESRDPLLDWIAEFTCRTLRLKPDKWSRMMVSDEQRSFLTTFIEQPYPQASFFFIKIRILFTMHNE